ncbi:MAG: AI-2E family transporter [Bacteroidota bacterium]
MPITFNNRLRQIILLIIIFLLALVLLKQMYVFLPGCLGAITMYILLREYFFNLTIKKQWNKSLVATGFIIISLVVFAIPIFFSIQLLTNKVLAYVNNSADLLGDAKLVGKRLEGLIGIPLLTDENIASLQRKITTFLPKVLNSSLNILSNLAVMFFLLYFLLVNGRKMETFLDKFIPLKEENVHLLSNETKSMIKANAIGIPILAVIQGVIAMIGYWIFGVNDIVLWGFLTGICSMIPIVGTGIIWVPLVAYFFAVNNITSGIGLLVFSAVILTNIDYVARLTILKRLINVHPLITIFGVIVGIGLFGFWGVIFGPLLISYFIILVKIYINEFGTEKAKSVT